MMFGVEAGTVIPVPPISDWLGQADFVNGAYSWGITTLTAADVVDQTGWISGGTGLVVPGNNAGAATLLNDFSTQLKTCQWTVVVDFDIDDFSGESFILWVENSAYIYAGVKSWYGWSCLDDDGGVSSRDGYSDASLSNGHHKIAATRVDSHLAISVDGNAVVIYDFNTLILPDPDNEMLYASLGGWHNLTYGGMKIRSLTVYDPQADGNLSSLSAL